MKKSIFKLFLLIVFVLSMTITTFSHPAQMISIEYRISSKDINVKVIHNTQDERKHFIKIVRVFHNDKLVTTKTFNKQQTKGYEQFILNLPGSKKGDKVKILTICNIRGQYYKDFILR